MNAVEKVCLDLCEDIFNTSSVKNKTLVNYSVKTFQDDNRTAEVTLVTNENEYTFVLNLPEAEVYSQNDGHLYTCSKCARENKYKLKCINIKGFHNVEFGKIDIVYLKLILEKLAEDHGICIEENKLEKKNYKTGLFTASDEIKIPLVDTLNQFLKEEHSIDPDTFFKGIKTIEKSYKTLDLKNNCIYVYGNNLQKKLFVKNSEKYPSDYKILNIRMENNIPLVYDVLLTIFSFTDQNMRQLHFHELVRFYYDHLENNLQKLCLDISKLLPWSLFRNQVRAFLPYVKFNVLKQFCQATQDKNHGEKNIELLIKELISELYECFLYPNLSREDCYEILRNKMGTTDYIFSNYKLIPLEEREGYLGDYFKLKIEINHEDVVEVLHFFAKYLPTYNDMARKLAVDSFVKEEFYYMKFISELHELGLSEILNFCPKCYLSRTNEFLIFEDMSMSYKTLHVSIPYDYKLLSMTLKQLAKIHASSILYEELSSRKYRKCIRLDDKYPEYVEEKTVRNTEETLIKKTFDCAISTFFSMMDVFPGIPKKLSMREFKERTKLAFDMFFEKVKKSDRFRNVLCHGDSWASNILFKTDKDILLEDCCIVDFQLTRYCPPAHDIYFLFYMVTTKEIRKQFESKLLKDYYTELSNILQKYDVDIQKIYTYEEFLKCCEYMRSQGLCHAIIILQFVLFPDEKLKTIMKDKEQVQRLFYENRDIFIQELQNEGQYKQRMKEFVEEMDDICESDNLLESCVS